MYVYCVSLVKSKGPKLPNFTNKIKNGRRSNFLRESSVTSVLVQLPFSVPLALHESGTSSTALIGPSLNNSLFVSYIRSQNHTIFFLPTYVQDYNKPSQDHLCSNIQQIQPGPSMFKPTAKSAKFIYV